MDERAVQRGRDVFAKHECAKCHAPPTYTLKNGNVQAPDIVNLTAR